jgi:cytoskeletal protein CcmA (bactofilin family)
MNRKKEKAVTPGRGEIKAFLGEGTDFKGILTFEGTVRVDGKLEGEIITKDTLIVGETAMVNAEIKVHTIVISGVVKGNIVSTGRVEVHRPGKLFGNIKTPILLIEEGVIFEGGCSMIQQEESKVSPLSAKKDSEVGKDMIPAVKND